MNKTRPVRTRKRHLRPRRAATQSRSALVKLLRPIVRDLMAEELDRLQDEGDAKASREALAEGGAVPHDEFWKRRGL